MIKRLLLENLSLKTTAVVLAMLLWIFVSAKGQTEISADVPINFINIPPGLEISKRTTKTATVVIRGHESLLKNVRQGDVRISVDVSKAKEGEGAFIIKKDDVTLPPTASVIKVEPSSVKAVFERFVTKNVRVRPVITGNPELGYYLKSIEVKPQNVLIEGAESEVNKVGYLKTELIDITSLTEDLGQEVELALSGKNVRTKVDRVNVTIKIARRGR